MPVEQVVDGLVFVFQGMKKNLRVLSLCLRSLYAENAVDSSAYNATGINTIRDQIRQDAVVYQKRVFPLSIEVVRCAQGFFEYYEGLELDEWSARLPEILEVVTGYHQCCNEVVRMHEEMMTPLKKRENEVKMLISGIFDINKELKKRIAQLEKEAASSEARAYRLSFIPFVGSIVNPELSNSAERDHAQAVANRNQVQTNEAAIVVVSGVLAQALSKFIDGLEHVAGFFNVMKEELIFLQSIRANQEEPTRHHYETIKGKTDEMKIICKAFHDIIPGVQTDLQCIPELPDDLGYFNEWQIKHLKVFKRIYNHMITAKLKTLLGKCQSIDEFQQIDIN